MGIRNHKGTIKIVSIILILGFALSMILSGILFLKNSVINHDSHRQVIAKVDGKKIYRDEFERELYHLKNNMSALNSQKKQQLAQMGVATDTMQELPENILKEYIFQTMIDREVLLAGAKKLKIKADESVINKAIENAQKQAGGKANLIQALTQSGYNLTTYKEVLREQEVAKKVQEKVLASSKVSEEEVKKMYERLRYSSLSGRTFEESKKEIEDSLNGEVADALINSFIEKEKAKAKIEIVSPEFKKLYEDSNKVVIEKDGYKYTNASVNEQLMSLYMSTPQGYSQEMVDTIKNGLKSSLERLLKIKAKAKEAGIKVSPELTGLSELSSYSKKYYNHLIDTYKPSEAAMQERFNSKKEMYNTQNTISGYVIGDEYTASSKDIEAAKKQAEDIMKSLTVENFAEKAKQFSKDPGSAQNGGSLGGEIDLTQLVPEFAEAVKKAEKGKIVGPVKTQFGYHIIYVQDKNTNNANLAKVSHILIMPTISQETKDALVKRLNDVKAELDSKKVTWEQVESQGKYNFSVKEKFKTLAKNDSIPGIGKNDPALMDKLFGSKTGEILTQQEEFGYFLLGKTGEVPFKEATFADVKERIRLEFAIEYANNELENIK